MPTLKVLQYPDPNLRKQAVAVLQFDDQLQQLTDNMFETMYADDAVGLAATQVDVQLRVMVIDVSENADDPQCLVNPEIIHAEELVKGPEGCMSLPGMFAEVERANKITVRTQLRDGSEYEFAAEGLLAICIQHELDHLDGKLFIDHLSTEERQLVIEKLTELREQAA